MRHEFPSTNLPFLKTPIHLVINVEPGRLEDFLRQGDLPLLSHYGCAHGENFPLLGRLVKAFRHRFDTAKGIDLLEGFLAAGAWRANCECSIRERSIMR